MNLDELTRYLTETFDRTTVLENDGDLFWIYDPDGDLPPERQLPYVTVVTGEDWEQVSNLSEPPGSYRLNIGLTKATYTSLFPTAPENTDYAARDRVMPHPTYGPQNWVCVVNPSDIEALKPLLAEAHEFAARKYGNYQARSANRE